jgi:hypothetical protein
VPPKSMSSHGNWEQEGRNVIATLARIEAKCESIDYALHGNGEPGIKTRLDRLERAAEGRTWFRRTIWVALIAALTTNSVAMVKVLTARADKQLNSGK